MGCQDGAGASDRASDGGYAGLKRVLDFVGSLTILTFLSLLLAAALAILLIVRGGKAIVRTPRVGLGGRVFEELSFNVAWPPLRDLLVLINILLGDLSFVGPRAASPGEFSVEGDAPEGLEAALRKRNSVRPGLVCDWWILQRVNMAYGHEAMTDAEYVDRQSLREDLGLVLRAMPSFLGYLFAGSKAGVPAEFSNEIRILDIRIDNVTMKEAIDSLMATLDQERPHLVCFVNPQCANVAYRDRAYKAVLDRADFVFADGIGMKFAGMILGRPIRQNVNGTDLFPQICETLAGSGKGIYLMGAKPGVADDVRAWIERNRPGVIVKGCHHGYFGTEGEAEVIREIRESGADMLFVAMGVPNQEMWISRHLEELGVKAAVGVGGLFDFYSGRIPRAPLWMREIGMEWSYRLWQEPGRMWRRYLVGNGVFLYRVGLERFFGRTASRGMS